MIRLYKGNTRCVSYNEAQGKVTIQTPFSHNEPGAVSKERDVIVVYPSNLSSLERSAARQDPRNEAAAQFNLHHSYTAHWRPDETVSALLNRLKIYHSIVQVTLHQQSGGVRLGEEMGDNTSYGIMLDAASIGPQTLKCLQEQLDKMQSEFLEKGLAGHIDRLAEDHGIPAGRGTELVQALAEQLGVDLKQAAGLRRA